MNTDVLIIPGIGDSGPDHWQTLWQSAQPTFRRVVQDDWDRPVCARWSQRLEAAVADAGPGVVLAAHSLGCLLVAHWAASTALRVRAALLVAVPDPAAPAFPAQAQGFAPVPQRSLAFPSIVVASTDDPYGSAAYAQRCAAQWGSRFVSVGAAGHINAASGLGDWPEGGALLDGLRSA